MSRGGRLGFFLAMGQTSDSGSSQAASTMVALLAAHLCFGERLG